MRDVADSVLDTNSLKMAQDYATNYAELHTADDLVMAQNQSKPAISMTWGWPST